MHDLLWFYQSPLPYTKAVSQNMPWSFLPLIHNSHHCSHLNPYYIVMFWQYVLYKWYPNSFSSWCTWMSGCSAQHDDKLIFFYAVIWTRNISSRKYFILYHALRISVNSNRTIIIKSHLAETRDNYGNCIYMINCEKYVKLRNLHPLILFFWEIGKRPLLDFGVGTPWPNLRYISAPPVRSLGTSVFFCYRFPRAFLFKIWPF
jgi:hypothetical protein